MKPFLCDGNIIDKSLQPKIMLNDCKECKVTEEINGIFECALTFPNTPQNSEYLTVGRCLYIKVSPTADYQFFRIYKTSMSLIGDIMVYSEHLRYVLNYYPCAMFKSSLSLLLARMNVISYGTIPFTFSGNTAFVNSVYGREIDINTVKNIGEVLCGSSGSIVDVCGGEWIFNNFNCHIVESRGSNRNVVLQYGYDINECNRDIEIQTAYTHIFPYYEWTLSDGTIANITLTEKDLDTQYPNITANDLIQIDTNYNASSVMKIYPINLATWTQLDLSTGYYDGLNIRTMADNWLTEHRSELLGVSVSTTLDFAYIQNNMALGKCELGDTVRIRIPKMNIETTARIRRTEYDSLGECYTKMDIGTLKTGLDTSIYNNTRNISNLNIRTTRKISMLANTIRT